MQPSARQLLWPVITILCLTGGFLLAGCRQSPEGGGEAPGRSSPKPIVVASIYPLYDWVRQIAGPAVEAHCLLPPAASPHTFAPTPQIAEYASRAALRVVVGLGTDSWAEEMAAGPGGRTLVLGETVTTIPLTGEKGKAGANPHVWLDPLRAAQMIQTLTEALVEIVPEATGDIQQRSRWYQQELKACAEQMTEQCRPGAGAPVVTMHAAYDYFLERCGLPPARVITPFAGKEPSARYLQRLSRQAREEHIRVIFAEPQLSPKLAETLAREIGGEILILDPLGDPNDPQRDTYMKLLHFNLQQLLKGLAVPHPRPLS